MKEIKIYEAFDGKRFDYEEECRKYEENLKPEKIIEHWLRENSQNNYFIIWANECPINYNNYKNAAIRIAELVRDFAEGNTDSECESTIGLFNYCIEDNSFGDICTVYCYDEIDDCFYNIFSGEI